MLVKSIVPTTIAFAIAAVNAMPNIFGVAIVHGNFTPSASYLAPFAPEDAVDQPFELVDDHEDLVTNHKGQIVSLRKRGDDCQKYHKVSRGDNCYTLSLKYNVEESSIHEWNDQINSQCSNLYPGKSYCVQKNNETFVEECTQTYKITSTDSCISVSRAHGLSLSEFYAMNPSVNRGSCDNLLTGASYCVKKQKVLKLAAAKVTKSTKTRRTKAVSKKTKKPKRTTTTTTTKKPTTTRTTTTTTTTTTKKTTTTTTTTTTTKKTTTTTTTSATPASSNKIKASKASKPEQRKLLQKGADLTYYWIAHPDDYDHSGKSINIKTCKGESLGTVSQEYADALVMEGTGIVGSKIVNLGGCSCSNYDCFMEVDKKDDPYGLTSYGSALRPFLTIAANDIKRNTKIYVPKLDGWEIPGSSKKHNGCLLVDDQSWSFEDNHIDFYVYREKNYRSLNGEHGVSSVDIYEGGDCNLLNYI